MAKKVCRRLEKNNREAARYWAAQAVKNTIADYCTGIDQGLWEESERVSADIEVGAKKILNDIPVDLGGGAAGPLLYFLVRKYIPKIVIETGVGAGWSTKTILRGISHNGNGVLYSSDFPYFRYKSPEQYVGILARDEKVEFWHLDTRGDEIALPNILNALEHKSVGLFHYDSDKSFAGRVAVVTLIEKHMADDGLFIMDDIQDNYFFRDLVSDNKFYYEVFEYQGKYVGLIPDFGAQFRQTTRVSVQNI